MEVRLLLPGKRLSGGLPARNRLLIFALFSATALIVLTLGRTFSVGFVLSESMEPYASRNDLVIFTPVCSFVNSAENSECKYRRGQIVVFDSPIGAGSDFDGAELTMKRIVALSGDKVSLSGGHLYINGSGVEEPYLHSSSSSRDQNANTWPRVSFEGGLTAVAVPPGEVFVLGDNRDRAQDSRQYGAIPITRLRGVVLASLHFSRF